MSAVETATTVTTLTTEAAAPTMTAAAPQSDTVAAAVDTTTTSTTTGTATAATTTTGTTSITAATTTTTTTATTTTAVVANEEEEEKTKEEGPPVPSSRRVTIGHNTQSSTTTAPTMSNHPNNDHTAGGTGSSSTHAATNLATTTTTQLPLAVPPHWSGTASTSGGSSFLGGGGMDLASQLRRSSMGSVGFHNMDDFFGARRNSFGFDTMGGMENFFGGRRDSMDSSTAALDMAIMDLSRRRYSAAMGASSSHNGSLPPSLLPPSDAAAHFGSLGSLVGFPPPGLMAASSSSASHQSGSAAPSAGSNNNDSIRQRQQQLQQQQRELELRQKELEFQRQQLISNMQERSYGPFAGAAGGGGGGMPSMYHTHHPHHHPRNHSLGGLGGSLGLGSVQSHGTGSLTSMPASMPTATTNSAGSASSSAAGSQKWWICQICQSKAFVSQDEALAHEAICQDVGHYIPMSALPYGHDMGMGLGMGGMGRNFSMGFGMDTSQRGMPPMGFTTAAAMIDNSSRGVVSLGMDSSRGGSTMDFDRSRNMSLGMDSSSSNYTNYGAMTMSTGPVNMFIQPVPLAMPSDKDWLTPLHCFVRLHCVEVFTATKGDVATPSKGKRKAIQVGQVGIRCPHCSSTTDHKSRERGSVYYPTSIASIYNATMNLLQRHLHSCPSVPDEIMRRYETLKSDDARSGTSKRYWIESALSLGLVDTPQGIRHSALPPPPLPTLTRQQETTGQDVARRASNEYFGNSSNLVKRDSNDEGNDATDADGNTVDENSMMPAGAADTTCMTPLVEENDKPYATDFSYQLMDQMQPCVFTEADRLGKRKGLPPGFPGLACRHCFGGYGSGRFFPSTIKTLSDTSKTLNVLHNHMMRCRKCPADVKESLEKLRVNHDEERSKMKFGSQKAFFGRIWERLHSKPDAYMQVMQRRRASKRPAEPQDQLLNGGYDVPEGGNFGGLEALAAASSPSKRSKV